MTNAIGRAHFSPYHARFALTRPSPSWLVITHIFQELARVLLLGAGLKSLKTLRTKSRRQRRQIIPVLGGYEPGLRPANKARHEIPSISAKENVCNDKPSWRGRILVSPS